MARPKWLYKLNDTNTKALIELKEYSKEISDFLTANKVEHEISLVGCPQHEKGIIYDPVDKKNHNRILNSERQKVEWRQIKFYKKIITDMDVLAKNNGLVFAFEGVDETRDFKRVKMEKKPRTQQKQKTEQLKKQCDVLFDELVSNGINEEDMRPVFPFPVRKEQTNEMGFAQTYVLYQKDVYFWYKHRLQELGSFKF